MLVFAHRGASDAAPGNTLKAFELAIEVGTFAIESDVLATRDVVPSSWLPVRWFRAFDAGGGMHVPLVDEVFDNFCKAGVLGKITWSLDVPDNVAFNRLARITRAFNMQESVQVCATSCKTNARWRRVAPSFVQVWSIRTREIEQLDPASVVAACKKCEVDVINVKLTEVTADLVNAARAAGLRVYIWDVHDGARYKKALAFNPDAIYTDSPSRVLDGTWDT
jgi:glycerophosphoryl diester phosphodiesterase